MLRNVSFAVLALLVLAGVGLYGAGAGWLGRHEGPGAVTEKPIPSSVVAERAGKQRRSAEAAGTSSPKQILFGDLHVHTTFSLDAFLFSLPLLSGEGAHPPADACDFARYCSSLDFWSVNDHAEGLTPTRWRDTVQSIRQCNAVAGDERNPDVVAYLGWEWTQVGTTRANHYGHKNVILLDTEEGKIPTRPIASRRPADAPQSALAAAPVVGQALFYLVNRDRRTLDFNRFMAELGASERCADGVPVRDLPEDCLESAPTPADLYAKLRDWGLESIVIPHGTSWGFYTPPGSTWDKQLTAAQNDPELQTLVEVYSGHGNSEEHRDWRAVAFDESGEPLCPEPTPRYLPSCWRAGELIRERCLEAGESAEECEERAGEARTNYLAAGVAGHHAVPGASGADWLDAGQCRDCFLPAFNHRPGNSVQYMMALTNFDDPSDPKRFRFGFMASSDNHTARPGTGYKEVNRREMTEAVGPAPGRRNLLSGPPEEPVARSAPVDTNQLAGFGFAETERIASFLSTGGLVAVHASGRDRHSIWEAMKRREVYGTSGGRMLLWFDLLNGPDGEAPMGSEVTLAGDPTFRVRAVGALEQRAGCPDFSTSSLSPERLHHLCRGECYHPSDERKLVTRIEVIRIRPQTRPGEPLGGLIEDPWRTIECPADPSGCTVTFTDPEYAAIGRDTLYYVRAIEEVSEAVNGANLRCTWDEEGNCLETKPCYGDPERTPYEDDCLAPVEERSWSSPIFVTSGTGVTW